MKCLVFILFGSFHDWGILCAEHLREPEADLTCFSSRVSGLPPENTAVVLFFFCHGWTAPNGPGPSDYRRYTITLCLPHSVGILCTHDRPVAETST
jgi:hypothetical protein